MLRRLLWPPAIVLLVAILLHPLAVTAQPVSSAYPLGTRLQLFVDDHLIDSMQGTRLKLHEPVLAAPLTGDVDSIEYGTVILDGDTYRLYTRARHESKKDGDGGEYTRYFESYDGKHWVAPELGLIDVAGTTWTNVVLHDPPYGHNFSPMLDTRPEVPADERFKALGGEHATGLAAFASADGIHWRKLSPEPMVASEVPWESRKLYDSQNVSFWSEAEGQYVCYFRTWFEGLRRIARMTSTDYRTWGDWKLMDVNADGEHLYTSQAHPYFRAPHIYIGLPTRFYPDRGSSTDILFMATRGDAPFSRPFHEAFIRPGLDPARWGNRSNYAAQYVVPTGPAEMSIYTTPFRRFALRTDGFVSVHAGAEAGKMTTHPVVFSGKKLVVNFATSAGGSLRVALLDSAGVAIPGYGLDSCDRLVGDGISHAVTWGQQSDIGAMAETPVRIRFELVDGDLYSIQFAE